ncbi:MAG: recombinase family protein [Anaerolineae bacterium]|nr:recombinase family protein [Anaerolineae bacterium]
MAYDKRKRGEPIPPQPGWAVYLRTSSDENQKPELSRARQRFVIEENVLKRSDMPVYDEYIDVLTGKTPKRKGYQQLLADARAGKFSHVIVERADRFGRNDTEALRAIDELDGFGVAVRFANSPDLDPMDPDGRVIVALSFTLARRETALLAIRVKGGLRAKRESGGFAGQAPDGYRNVQERTLGDTKRQLGRFTRRIEIDPERAPVIREAWDLLLTDKLTLPEIAEALYAKGYRHRSGRPFVEVTPTGKRKTNISCLSRIFHNWAYAGWIVSPPNQIAPKTLQGNWEPIITTEEMERGQEILTRRNMHRSVRRKQVYLLQGMIFYQPEENKKQVRLTCSTSNARRSGRGTAYYRVSGAGEVSFLCRDIDAQVGMEMHHIQVDPDLMPLIRAAYTHELAENLGYLRPDEKEQIKLALKAVDDEEARTVRLLAAGKITETIWESLWSEWQDRRRKLRVTLETLDQNRAFHIDNLDAALRIIARIGTLYNGLQQPDQKELLRQMVERVVVNHEGKVRLELRAPFAYLKDLTDEVRMMSSRREVLRLRHQLENKTGGDVSPARPADQSSTWIQFS